MSAKQENLRRHADGNPLKPAGRPVNLPVRWAVCIGCGSKLEADATLRECEECAGRCLACRAHPGWASPAPFRRRDPFDYCPACLGTGSRLGLEATGLA